MESIRVKVEMRELQVNNPSEIDSSTKATSIAAPGAISIKNTLITFGNTDFSPTEREFIHDYVGFLDDHLGDYIAEPSITVKHQSTLHGSLIILLEVTLAAAEITSTLLKNTTSLLENSKIISEAIKDLTAEWGWQRNIRDNMGVVVNLLDIRSPIVSSNVLSKKADSTRQSAGSAGAPLIATAALLSFAVTLFSAYFVVSSIIDSELVDLKTMIRESINPITGNIENISEELGVVSNRVSRIEGQLIKN